jgi:hypothetical protein
MDRGGDVSVAVRAGAASGTVDNLSSAPSATISVAHDLDGRAGSAIPYRIGADPREEIERAPVRLHRSENRSENRSGIGQESVKTREPAIHTMKTGP